MPRIATADRVDREELLDFLRPRHRAILLTRRTSGGPQLSPVTCGVDAAGRVVVSTYPQRAKVANARRDPAVTLCVLSDDWDGPWVQVDGTAEVLDQPAAIEPLVEYYRSISGEHPDWDTYRAAMARQGKSLLQITVQRWGPIATGGFPPGLAPGSWPGSARFEPGAQPGPPSSSCAPDRQRRGWTLRRPRGDPVPDPTASRRAANLDLLGVYVNDHLASATGGVELVSRMIAAHAGRGGDEERLRKLRGLLTELREERAAHVAVAGALGLPVRSYKQLGTWVAEKVSRVKFNGRLFSRSPLSDLVEFEFLATAVLAKRAGFETLLELAAVEERLDADLLRRLVDQADAQHRWLSHTRRAIAAEIFGGSARSADEAAET